MAKPAKTTPLSKLLELVGIQQKDLKVEGVEDDKLIERAVSAAEELHQQKEELVTATTKLTEAVQEHLDGREKDRKGWVARLAKIGAAVLFFALGTLTTSSFHFDRTPVEVGPGFTQSSVL